METPSLLRGARRSIIGIAANLTNQKTLDRRLAKHFAKCFAGNLSFAFSEVKALLPRLFFCPGNTASESQANLLAGHLIAPLPATDRQYLGAVAKKKS
jgi:primosomal protein N''